MAAYLLRACSLDGRTVDVLLGDRPIAIVEGLALAAAAAGLLLSSVARQRASGSANRVAELFWHDVSLAGYVWATATVALLAGGLMGIEGLRIPIWLLVAIVVGIACLGIVRLRWARQGLASASSAVDDTSRPDRPRLASTTWEVATLAAFAAGLLVYGVTMSHGFGHPVHWLVAAVGAAVGYAIGLVVGTPRYIVKKGST